MEREVQNRLDLIQTIAQTDMEYAPMLRQMRELEKRYNEVLAQLLPDQQDIICDFVSQCEGMSWRMLEIACTLMRFPQN